MSLPHLHIDAPHDASATAVAEWLTHQAEALAIPLSTIRRTLHQHPEISCHEEATAALVTGVLDSLGLETRTQVGGHGVMGLLRGARPGPTVALRADMDALGIQDEKEVTYRSQVANVSHACGHDCHTTAALGAAILLARLTDHLPGQVKFLFQPAEEHTGAGASDLIAAGVMADPKVDAIFALHVQPHIRVGQVGVRRGVMMAAADLFTIEIDGQPGHAARPDECVDTVLVAAHVVTALHQIIPRRISIHEPVVLTIGNLHSGIAPNVIPGHATMAGTVRTLSDPVRRHVRAEMERVIDGITRANGATYRLHYEVGAPPVINDPALTDLFEAAAAKVVGAENIVEITEPSMGGDDFSCYLDHAPGVYFRLGSANDGEATQHPLHHACFDVDESALPLGAHLLAQTAWDFLSQRR